MAADQSSEVQKIQISEDALREAQAQRDELLHELDDLARFLSHDLRAPLRGIDGYSKALIEDYGDQLDALALSYLQFINESGRQAANLLDNLIHYIRTPHAKLELVRVDLSEMAEDILTALTSRQSAALPRLIDWQVEPGLSTTADERLARLLLAALLENAWKFTSKHSEAHIVFGALPRGEPTGRGNPGGAQKQDGRTIYFVQDDGAGFDPVYAGRLFKPFQRLHSAHEFDGAGMGLAVSQRIVARHGGQIWAHGEVDRGVTVYFTLEGKPPAGGANLV